MGYKPQRPTYVIEFEDAPGLELRCTSTSLGKLQSTQQLSADPTKQFEAFKVFVDNVVSWNIEHPDMENDEDDYCTVCGSPAGVPLAVSLDGLKCLDLGFVTKLFMGWVQGMTQVSIPKDLNSSLGESAQKELIQMLGQLQSPTTLPKLS
jgi:hypothetical protein